MRLVRVTCASPVPELSPACRFARTALGALLDGEPTEPSSRDAGRLVFGDFSVGLARRLGRCFARAGDGHGLAMGALLDGCAGEARAQKAV